MRTKQSWLSCWHPAVRCCVEGFGRKEIEQEKFHKVCPTIHHPWARHAYRNTTIHPRAIWGQSCGTMTRRNSTVLPNLKTNLPFFLLQLQISSHVCSHVWLAFRFHSSSLVWSSSYDETVLFLYFWTRQPQTNSLAVSNLQRHVALRPSADRRREEEATSRKERDTAANQKIKQAVNLVWSQLREEGARPYRGAQLLSHYCRVFQPPSDRTQERVKNQSD